MDIKFFASPAAFRAWLEKHHDGCQELFVGFYKRGSGKSSITWPESVDAALCFGWIDGVRKSVDEISYTIRFSPRKPRSIWSEVNVKRVQDLMDEGLMRPAGAAAFEARIEAKSAVYSYEQRGGAKLGDVYERRFRANKKAWAFFHCPGALVSENCQLVGHQREERRDAAEATRHAHRRLGACAPDRAAEAPRHHDMSCGGRSLLELRDGVH